MNCFIIEIQNYGSETIRYIRRAWRNVKFYAYYQIIKLYFEFNTIFWTSCTTSEKWDKMVNEFLFRYLDSFYQMWSKFQHTGSFILFKTCDFDKR